ILYVGAEPVFVDIDPGTYNLDPELVEAAVTPRTRAILPVDQIGLAAEVPAILEIGRRRGLKVVEDAAPSLGATVGSARVGSLSDLTCFSFHPRKSITTGEGGMITTADGGIAARPPAHVPVLLRPAPVERAREGDGRPRGGRRVQPAGRHGDPPGTVLPVIDGRPLAAGDGAGRRGHAAPAPVRGHDGGRPGSS